MHRQGDRPADVPSEHRSVGVVPNTSRASLRPLSRDESLEVTTFARPLETGT